LAAAVQELVVAQHPGEAHLDRGVVDPVVRLLGLLQAAVDQLVVELTYRHPGVDLEHVEDLYPQLLGRLVWRPDPVPVAGTDAPGEIPDGRDLDLGHEFLSDVLAPSAQPGEGD
jgi:hypothetical protein